MSPGAEEEARPGGIEPAAAQPLAELVQYAEGAVVSRTILDKEQGTLTLFAFDAGQGLSEHAAPFDAYVIGLDGEAELVIAGEPVAMRSGQVVLMPADVPHAVRARSRFKMMLVMVRA
ncbi:MAG: cupin domain-containing protein [Planctomycetota bacterium]|jgi:quercetin dioxygenase-like cupin family protein